MKKVIEMYMQKLGNIDDEANSDSCQVGKHIDTPEENFDPKELRAGMEVEKEHTDDPEIAKQIAKDHLSEIPDYYTRLLKMEAEAKGSREVKEEYKVDEQMDYKKAMTDPRVNSKIRELVGKFNMHPEHAKTVAMRMFGYAQGSLV